MSSGEPSFVKGDKSLINFISSPLSEGLLTEDYETNSYRSQIKLTRSFRLVIKKQKTKKRKSNKININKEMANYSFSPCVLWPVEKEDIKVGLIK